MTRTIEISRPGASTFERLRSSRPITTTNAASAPVSSVAPGDQVPVGSWRSRLISLVVAFFLVVSLAGLLPDSETSSKVDQLVGPAIGVTGIRQNWAVFSPNPLTLEAHTHGVVHFEDGTWVEWRLPVEGVIDSSRAERWRKWESRVRQNDYEAHWPQAAAYIADQYRSSSSPVARVRLVRTWTEVPAPSEPVVPRQVNEFHFYEWDPSTETGLVLDKWDQDSELGQS